MPSSREKELLGLDLQALTRIVQEHGEPPYRGRQLFEAIYRQGVSNVDAISTLPSEFRRQLVASYSVGAPEVEKKFNSMDGTIRYLMRLSDGEMVETVWMPEGDGGETGDESEDDGRSTQVFNRATICVSSQVGCAVNCHFCMTALLGVKRNLKPGEIVGQVLTVFRDRRIAMARPADTGVRESAEGIRRINLVFMGMGEPFLNYDNFMRAVRLLVEGVGVAESRMTVSTAGIVPRIQDFGKEPVRPKLAISLNASNDETRSRLMPINRKWNLEALLRAAREFPLRRRERLTFEYVLLDGVNDGEQNAREVAALLAGLQAKVNLIALNPGPEISFSSPPAERVLSFQNVLVEAGVPTFIRRPRGRDIYAACGQLKRTVSLESGI
jgi:23S rRNA (adenine2503-C2)-methyltransferase